MVEARWSSWLVFRVMMCDRDVTLNLVAHPVRWGGCLAGGHKLKQTVNPCLLTPCAHEQTACSNQSLNRAQLFETPWTSACQASLSFTISQSLFRFMSIESVMPSSHLILCHPLLLLPSIFPRIRVFFNESVLIRWPKYWSFSFSISPSSEYSGLISFRMDWLDLLAVQKTLKSLLQHQSSKAPIL